MVGLNFVVNKSLKVVSFKLIHTVNVLGVQKKSRVTIKIKMSDKNANTQYEYWKCRAIYLREMKTLHSDVCILSRRTDILMIIFQRFKQDR